MFVCLMGEHGSWGLPTRLALDKTCDFYLSFKIRLAILGLRFGPIWAEKLMWRDQNLVQNRPGLRPGQFGTRFWSVHTGFTAKIAPNRSSKLENTEVLSAGHMDEAKVHHTWTWAYPGTKTRVYPRPGYTRNPGIRRDPRTPCVPGTLYVMQ
jgi:hypothetical protein